MRTLHYKTRMIELAGEINSEMPAFWVRKVQDALNEAGLAMRGAKVLVLGVAYKKDIDDLRESPALEIIDQLVQKGAAVQYHDAFCPEIRDDGHVPAGAVGRSGPLTDDLIRESDVVVIVTDHSNIDYRRVCSLARAVIDTRNACGSSRAAESHAAEKTPEAVSV